MRVCSACVNRKELTCRPSVCHFYCLFDICYRHNADFMNVRLKRHVEVRFKELNLSWDVAVSYVL